MNCPRCQAAQTRVLDSRVIEGGQAVRRRRQCRRCDMRFTTFERLEAQLAVSLNQNGEALLTQISSAPGQRLIAREEAAQQQSLAAFGPAEENKQA